jgi:hypothetical protein
MALDAKSRYSAGVTVAPQIVERHHIILGDHTRQHDGVVVEHETMSAGFVGTSVPSHPHLG